VNIVGPEAAGLDTGKVQALLDRAHREVDEGLLPSCQVAIARDGKLAVFETIGAPSSSRYVIYSATKAFVASAFWLLLQDGAISLDQKVAELIPEFGTNGKDVVTVEQVMLHTCGFPYAPLGPPAWSAREARLAAFARWRLSWEPGTRFEYHPTSAHWVLAELIERAAGQDYRTFVHDQVLDPLGLRDAELGVTQDRLHEVRRPTSRGEPASPDELEAALGIRELGRFVVSKEELLALADDGALAVGVPGGGLVANAAAVALFYQALLSGGPWSDQTRRAFTAEVRNVHPDLRGIPANRTLGLVVKGDDEQSHLRGFGRTCSARTFGHGGAGGQLAFADPDTGMSFCYLTDGLDEHLLREWRRSAGIANRAGVCAPV
jgi:CubicO group peptidase (beta-lactamase class C family)